MHCWGFTKDAYWLNHWSLVMDLNLSELPSSPRSRKYKPVISSLSVAYSISSVGNSSWVLLSNCIPDIITWPMKESKFQEFRRHGPRNKKRNTDAWYNTSQKTIGERAWRLSLYCISLAPTGYPTRSVFLAFPAAAPHLAQIFWLLLIIWE